MTIYAYKSLEVNPPASTTPSGRRRHWQSGVVSWGLTDSWRHGASAAGRAEERRSPENMTLLQLQSYLLRFGLDPQSHRTERKVLEPHGSIDSPARGWVVSTKTKRNIWSKSVGG